MKDLDEFEQGALKSVRAKLYDDASVDTAGSARCPRKCVAQSRQPRGPRKESPSSELSRRPYAVSSFFLTLRS